MSSNRRAAIERNTKETQLRVELDLDGQGRFQGAVGVPFLEHMLDLLARHSRIDLAISGQGDTQIDPHHTVEDLGIVMGQALAEALGEKRGIARFGGALAPMEESLARCALDICGRPYLHYAAEIPNERIGAFDTELTEDFFRALTNNAGLTLHLHVLYGKNTHHMIEALFKAFALSLRQSAALEPGASDIPSTKGVLA